MFVLKALRNYFITGLLVLLPIVATVYILGFIVNMAEILVRPVGIFLRGEPVYGLGFVLTILIILLVGMVATNVLGKKAIGLGERLLARIPIIRSIYNTAKQLFDALLLRNKTAFKKVVMFEYPRKGIYQIGFLTYKGEGEIQHRVKREVVHVFLPTTPNPTSGFLLFIPEEDVVYLQMTVEEGLRLILSAGVFSPEFEVPEEALKQVFN